MSLRCRVETSAAISSQWLATTSRSGITQDQRGSGVKVVPQHAVTCVACSYSTFGVCEAESTSCAIVAERTAAEHLRHWTAEREAKAEIFSGRGW